MKLPVFKHDGKRGKSKVDLRDSIFRIEPNETVVYEDVRRFMANRRQGSAKTKERSEVRGGGRKAYRQKGTGMARRGSIRSPLLKGGGTVFGPQPRNYTVKMTKKMRRLARKSALSLKAADEVIFVIEDLDIDEPKTKSIVELLSAFELDGKKVLILTSESKLNVYKSARNLQGVDVLEADKPATYQILNADALLIEKSGLDLLQESVEPTGSEEAAA